MKPLSRSILVVLVLVAAWPAWTGTPDRGQEAAEPEARTRVHADAGEVLRAFVEALEALLAEQPKRAKLALDRVAEASPVLMPEDTKSLGRNVVGADDAFHDLLNLAREMANKGDNANAFRYHQGLQRTCLGCHRYARDDGVFVGSGDE